MTKSLKPAAFYKAESLDPADSVGLLAKRVLASITHAVDEHLAEHELTHAQWVPLFRLSRGDCIPTPNELARYMDVDPGAITRAMDRLEAKGLIRRARSTDDRRVVNIELTDEGHRVAALVPPVLADVLNAHLAGFTRTEWRTLVDLLQRVLANGEALRQAKETP